MCIKLQICVCIYKCDLAVIGVFNDMYRHFISNFCCLKSRNMPLIKDDGKTFLCCN